MQTTLTSGQESREGYQPFGAFAEKAVVLFARHPTAPEILVKRIGFLGNAEAEGRFAATLAHLNAR